MKWSECQGTLKVIPYISGFRTWPMMISQFEEMEFDLDGGNLPRSHKGRRNEPEMEKSDVQGGADRCYLIPAYIVSIFQF